MTKSNFTSSFHEQWVAVIHKGSETTYFSGTMETDGTYRLFPAKLLIEPPVTVIANPHTVNMFVGMVKSGDISTIEWLNCTTRSVSCSYSGFRWEIQKSRNYLLSFRGDVWPSLLKVGPAGTSTTKQYRFEVEDPGDDNEKMITVPLGTSGRWSLRVAGSERSLLLTKMCARMRTSIRDVLNSVPGSDALHRVATALTHILLGRNYYDDQNFVTSVMVAQETVKMLQHTAWSYSECRSHDPISVANHVLSQSRAKGASSTETELLALSLSQYEHLVVRLDRAGEISATGTSHVCRHFAIHPGNGDVRFLCSEFAVDTFSITPGGSQTGAVCFEHSSRDEEDARTEIADLEGDDSMFKLV